LVVAASLLFLTTCNRKKEPTPGETFKQIRLTFLQGDLARSQVEADSSYKQFSGRNVEWAWRFRLLEAEILANQGLSQNVLSLLDSQLPESLAPGPLSVRKHMLEALAYSHIGQAEKADQNLQEAETLCRRSQCVEQGEVARIAGAVEAERNHADKAEHFFRESLQIAREQDDHFLEASDLLNLGVVAIGKEHFDESVQWSDQAQKLARVINARLTEEKALGNLGWAYYKMGDFDKSLDFFVAATKKSQELGVVIDQVEWLNNQGLVYFQTNRFPLAEKYYQQSLQLARKSQNKLQMIAALTALAFVSVKTKQVDQASRYEQEAYTLAHHGHDRSDELYASLVQAQLAAHSGDGKHAEQLFLEVGRDPQSDTSLRWEAQDNLAGLYESEHRMEAADKQYRQSLATLEAARSSLRHEEFQLPFLANATHLYDDYVHFLVEQGKTTEALRVADYSRAQTLMEGLGLLRNNSGFRPTPVNAQQVARATGGTILFYWLGQGESYLWAVTPQQTALFRLPPESEIDALAQKYRKALTGPLDVLETGNPDGRQLYDMLVAPAKKLIAHNSQVLIIPDGSLNNLNFETLLVPKPTLHYWIEDVTVTNANSLRLLAASARFRAPKTKNLLLIGDAVAPNREYGDLPNAAVEMKSIEDHFPAGERCVLARGQATAEAYLASKAERFSYIHFVAHGTASELSPLDSAIVLSKSSADDSFKLYAREIIQHPLHARLVIISSCYGEGARAYTGEGLVGLSWAFLRAGAHNVIGALWEVSDTSTPQLMDHLYSGLMRGESPAIALRNAQLDMLHSGGVFRKPYYWAPFQLYTGF
jgi:CHAT domain-containing protein